MRAVERKPRVDSGARQKWGHAHGWTLKRSTIVAGVILPPSPPGVAFHYTRMYGQASADDAIDSAPRQTL